MSIDILTQYIASPDFAEAAETVREVFRKLFSRFHWTSLLSATLIAFIFERNRRGLALANTSLGRKSFASSLWRSRANSCRSVSRRGPSPRDSADSRAAFAVFMLIRVSCCTFGVRP